MFPKDLERVKVPPIKCQGIKTKLVEFITSSIKWEGDGTWYEPFMGSGVVTFNALPQSLATPTASADFVTKAYGDANYGGGSTVTSVFGRSGAVVATAGDYTAAQVTNAFDTSTDTFA